MVRKDIFLISLIYTFCLFFVYFFYFDVFLSSDSAWAGVVELRLLREGLPIFVHLRAHPISYLFAYYLIQYFILKLIPYVLCVGVMHALNLINGIFFPFNIVLVYILLRRLSCAKALSFSLALLYFFIPTVFKTSLYTSPNTFSLFFYLIAQIIFVGYLRTGKTKDLALVLLFSIVSVVIRIETFLFYCSFISLAMLFNKSLKKSAIIFVATAVISILVFLAIQGLLLPSGQTHNQRGFSDIYRYFYGINFKLIFVGFLQILTALGLGLAIAVMFFIIRDIKVKDFQTPIAVITWFIPSVFINIIAPHLQVTRYSIPSFLACIVLIAISIKRITHSFQRQILIVLGIYILHFAAMVVPYHLVKKYYPLKRHYKAGERIVLEDVLLGNIFTAAYNLREEKRRVWKTAEETAKGHDKIIILSNNVNRIPYYYFLYHLYNGIEMSYIKNAETYWVFKNKRIVFIDILPTYDRNKIEVFLHDPEFSDFAIHFPPYIPERVPELYSWIKEFCKSNQRELL